MKIYPKHYISNFRNPTILALLNEHPNNILQLLPPLFHEKGRWFIFLDEIQYLKDPTNFLKFIYDTYWDTIKLIVTWSSSFYIDTKFHDSLAWRKKIFYVYPLDFAEYLHFLWYNDLLHYLWESIFPIQHKELLDSLLADYMLYGGYPKVVLEKSTDIKKELLQMLVDSYITKDIQDAHLHHPEKYIYILKMLASQSGQMLNMTEIANTLDITLPTVQDYIYVMKKSFHIATVSPMYTNIRKEITKMPKVYYFDLWLKNALLRQFEPIYERVDKWQIFENLVFRSLLTAYDGNDIKYRRTKSKKEIDFIVGEKTAIEVKWNLSKFSWKDYQFFTSMYPEVKLTGIGLENINSLFSDYSMTKEN